MTTLAALSPLRALRFNPDHVRLARVLAPPYDVITPLMREALYARDLRNIVRIDFGRDYPGDVPQKLDRYTRAREHLDSWRGLDILRRDPRPGVYVSEHEFITPAGVQTVRRGVFARVAARPWDESELRPHERTLRGPKADRLALMHATKVQTSPVFGIWDHAAGLASLLEEMAAGHGPAVAGSTEGELGRETHRLWVVDDPQPVDAVLRSLRDAQLYVADGHHRYESAVAYAREMARDSPPDSAHDLLGNPGSGWGTAADPAADSGQCLVYLCPAADPAVILLATHRLVRPRPGMPATISELTAHLTNFEVEPVTTFASALDAIATRRATCHAFAVATADGAAVVSRPRRGGDVRAGLDTVVLEDGILGSLGITGGDIAEGALGYTRAASDLPQAVARGEATLGFALNGCTTAEVTAVAAAGSTMPQKSTYFYPKVPTGLVLSPL